MGIALGQYNQLEIIGETGQGLLLGDDGEQRVLLPKSECKESFSTGEELTVFVYIDSKDQLVATLKKPLVTVGQFAWLKVVDVTPVGAFLDWGLPKDLLLPYAEQKFEPQVGRRVMVRVYIDNSDRLAASTRLNNFLEEDGSQFNSGQPVNLLIAEKTDMGYKAIVDNSHWGVLYQSDLYQPILVGQQFSGYIKKVRDDKKLDLTLNKTGFSQVEVVAEKIIERLQQHEGFLMITDKSPPEMIYSIFKVSKKVYKKSVGVLYKQRRISIEDKGIRLLTEE